jgi:hypothetical protein
MVAANPLWRAPRIHGELTMLGIEISERTVSRILRTLRRPPSQTWKTFLHNHLGQLMSIDFFTVPRVLFEFIVLEHRRREVLHFNVTEHPTAAWTSQQIIEAFADREAPRYLIRDRDGVYGNEVRLWIASLTHGRSPHRASESLAESIRRTPDRLHTKRLLEPLRDPERQVSQENPGFVFRLLPRIEDPFGPRQAMSICSSGLEYRKDHRDPATRGPASPL